MPATSRRRRCPSAPLQPTRHDVQRLRDRLRARDDRAEVTENTPLPANVSGNLPVDHSNRAAVRTNRKRPLEHTSSVAAEDIAVDSRNRRNVRRFDGPDREGAASAFLERRGLQFRAFRNPPRQLTGVCKPMLFVEEPSDGGGTASPTGRVGGNAWNGPEERSRPAGAAGMRDRRASSQSSSARRRKCRCAWRRARRPPLHRSWRRASSRWRRASLPRVDSSRLACSGDAPKESRST